MTLKKLRPTYAFDEERIASFKALVPEAWADGKINFETLRELLGAEVEEGPEHFGLTWPGKQEARRLAGKPSKGTLTPATGEGVNEATTQNVFIEGDNLEVLKLLQKSYAGRVKMIYIDPPYNTGNDFIYKDDYREPLEAYLRRTGQMGEGGELLTSNPKSDGRFHSNWLNMLYPRLRVARSLLSNDGIIFVSIDDNEAANLRLLMDEVFGSENYLTTLYIQVRYEGKTLVEDMDFQKLVELVYVYGKSSEAGLAKPIEAYSYGKFTWKVVEKGKPKVIELGGKKVEVFASGDYEIIDAGPSKDHLKEIWATGKILDGNSSGRFFRDYLSGRYEQDGYGILYKVHGIGGDKYGYRYFTGPKKVGATKGKYYQGVPLNLLEDDGENNRALPIVNFYNFADNFGNCRHEGNVDFRSGKKPINFIKTLLALALGNESNAIVLDFFAGSCSTAHAVLNFNRTNGTNHKFICVQLPERIDNADHFTIADLGKQRIRNVLSQIRSEQPGQIPLRLQETLEDLGFKVFKLTASNFKPWEDYEGENLTELQARLDLYESPLVEGWTKEGLLTEVLLMQGFPLDSRVTRLSEFKVNEVVLVESDFYEHRLLVCLDEKIKVETIEQLELEDDDVIVCLDSALTDEAKMWLADVGKLYVI